MPGAGRLPVVGQRDVDGFLGQHAGIPLGDQGRLAGRDRLVDPGPGLPDPPPGGGLFRLWQVGDRPVGQRQRAPVAGVCEPGRLQRVEIGGGGDRGEGRRRRGFNAGGIGGARVVGRVGGRGHSDLPGVGVAG